MNKERCEEKPSYLSPLNLIYSAYAADGVSYSPAIEKGLEQINQYLSKIPKEDKNAVLRIMNSICQEKEMIAFRAGIQSGVRLMEGLSEL